MITHYIYGIFNDKTNELVYVGSTTDVEKRLMAHKCTIAKDFRNHCRIEVFESTRFRKSMLEAFWINAALGMGCKLINKYVMKGDYDLYLKSPHMDEDEEYIKHLEWSKQWDIKMANKIAKGLNCKVDDLI